MPEINKKLSKKELEQDKLVTIFYKSIELYELYKRQFFTGLGVLALAIVLIVLYSVNNRSNNQKAGIALSKVQPLYDQGDYQDAVHGNREYGITGLMSIVKSYGSTENGEIAKVYLGNAFYFTGNYKAALDQYESFSGGSDIYKAASLSGRAMCYESMNQQDKAAAYYKKAADVSKDNVLNSEYLLKEGIDFLAIGKKQEAKEAFDQIRMDYKGSEAFSEVERYMVQIED